MNEAHRRAVFLMLAGENVAAVSAQSGICRTSLYKLRRRRATDAVRRENEHTTKRIRISGLMYFNRRRVYISPKLAGEKIKIFETLDGLEAEDEADKFHFLPDYKTKICRPLEKFVCGSWIKDNSTYYFKPIRVSNRLKSENQMSRVKTANNSRSICLKNDKGCSHLAVAQ